MSANLQTTQSGNGVITLKEITDLLEVRHDKAMAKVEKLSEEPSFGAMSKMDTINLNGLKVATYLLTKKQAIAVGAKLNNSLLMKLIDKLEDMETKKVALSRKDLALMVIEQENEIEKLSYLNKNNNEFISNVVHSKTTYTATQIAKDFNIAARLLNKILVEANVIFKQNGTYVLTSKYQGHNLTEIKNTEPNKNGKSYSSLRWTVNGKNWLTKNFEKALQRCDEDTFNEYNKQILSNLPQIPMPRERRF